MTTMLEAVLFRAAIFLFLLSLVLTFALVVDIEQEVKNTVSFRA